MAACSQGSTCYYFGTFNPIHAGHLMIAQAALAQFGVENNFCTITFMPAGNPPHRNHEQDLLEARQRLAMVRLATADNPGFRVSDFELRQPGLSYTAETLRALTEKGLALSPTPMIIGSDALAGLGSWHDPTYLAENALFLQAPRPDSPFVRALMLNDQPVALNTQAIEMPMLALSSTWIRQCLRESADTASLRHFLPEPVRQYIRDNDLYQGTKWS